MASALWRHVSLIALVCVCEYRGFIYKPPDTLCEPVVGEVSRGTPRLVTLTINNLSSHVTRQKNYKKFKYIPTFGPSVNVVGQASGIC